MPSYKYKVKDAGANTLTGAVEAKDKQQAIEKLHQQKWTIIHLEESKEEGKGFKLKKSGVKPDDLVIFCRQLATMIDAGIPLVQTLDILSQQIEKKAFQGIISNLRDDIETGTSLSASLSRFPKVFPIIFINMVKAGESSGRLNEILERLATFLEKNETLKRKIRTAMIYPAIVFSMALIITLVLLLKVVPSFKGIFDMLGGELPLPTRILIGISDWCLHFFPIILAISICLTMLAARYARSAKGRLRIDRAKLHIFIFGPLFLKVAVSKFSRTLSTLLKSGVSILEALDIVGKVSGNKVVEEALKQVKQKVQVGESIAEPLASFKIFPPMVVRMIGVGEQSGELEKMLTKISDFYDEQVDAMVNGLTSLIEPIVIAFLGIIIGGIVIAMFLPIFKLTQLVGQ